MNTDDVKANEGGSGALPVQGSGAMLRGKSLLNPANLVRRALALVPQLRWVLAAVAALILFAVGASFYQTHAGAFVAGLAVLFLAGLAAILFLAIRRAEQKGRKSTRTPGDLLLWVIAIVASCCFVLTLTSVALNWPRPFQDIVDTLSGGISVPKGPQDLTFTGDENVTLEELPARFKNRPNASDEAKDRGSLTLINSALRLPTTADAQQVQFVFDQLNLLKNSRIITNGGDLTLLANEIASEGGKIISFPDDQLHVASPTTTGTDGPSGRSGGSVRLEGISKLRRGPLSVRLAGQDGANGTTGLDGTNGPNGTEGSTGVTGLFGCLRGPGNGNPGQPGIAGQRGGNGGNGGNGGHLVVVGGRVNSKAIAFEAPGGTKGTGARGGSASAGGVGGGGGGPSGFCTGNGARGANGLAGARGVDGRDGTDGRVGGMRVEQN